MQVQHARSGGTDRRQTNQSSTITSGPGRRWYEASFDPMAGGTGPYDPYDPYWEPMKGQDDD
jgi:hypothetical protein